MATTTGKLTVTSNDLTSDKIAFSVEGSMIAAPYGDGCVNTSGLSRVTIASGATYVFDCDAVTTKKSTAATTPGTNFHKNYLFIKNVDTANVTLKVTTDGSTYLPAAEGRDGCDFTLAMLEKGDFLYIPWTANVDLLVRATTSAACLMEYMIVN
tara:strand:- start:24280 stop:24741 length:462 start_codon:yes stop_codon:yes gene_type:complete